MEPCSSVSPGEMGLRFAQAPAAKAAALLPYAAGLLADTAAGCLALSDKACAAALREALPGTS